MLNAACKILPLWPLQLPDSASLHAAPVCARGFRLTSEHQDIFAKHLLHHARRLRVTGLGSLERSRAMHTWWIRGNAILTLCSSVLAAVCLAVAFTGTPCAP